MTRPVKSFREKYSASVFRKIMVVFPIPPRHEGRMRIVTKRAVGCDGRFGVAGRAATKADGEIV
jgi:hypothetical protein